MTIPVGRLITFEGVDGSGKTTQLSLLREHLIQRGILVVTTREPGGTTLGEKLRDILLRGEFECSPETEMLMLFAARSHNIDTVIRPAMDAGQWVLCDRFTDATFAYQGGGRQMGLKDIEILQTLVQGDFRPNKTFLLDLPVEEGILRLTRRGEVRDRIEQQDFAFKQRVREAYLERHRQCRSRIAIVDASAPIDEVHKAIIIKVMDMLGSSESKHCD